MRNLRRKEDNPTMTENELIVMAKRKYKQEWRDAHREHIREYHKSWREANAEHIKAYREANKERFAESQRKYWLKKAKEMQEESNGK